MKKGGTEISTKDPVAAVRQYIDGFNKGDAKVMAALSRTGVDSGRHGATRVAGANSRSGLV
jgi:hypothetical protein